MDKRPDISASNALFDVTQVAASGDEHLPNLAEPDTYDLINAITAVGFGIRTNLLWLDRPHPDIEAARRTARKLLRDFARMERLMRTILVVPD